MRRCKRKERWLAWCETALTLGIRYVVEKIMSHMIDAKVRSGFNGLKVGAWN
jgi:hypothetical protein